MFFAKFFEPKPFNQGYLPEKDGHSIFFMEFGNPKGIPLIIIHGGPGGECKARHAGRYNLKKYHVIMFDQRGCGKSLPFGKIEHNDVQSIIYDMEELIKYLNIKQKIILRGASWGSTVALVFAEKYPDKIEKLVLSQIFLARKSDMDWELQESARFYPDIMEKIKAEVQGWNSIPEYYTKLINSNDKMQQIKAASLYGSYERCLGSLNPKVEVKEFDDISLTYIKIYINYAAKYFTLKNNQIIHDIKKIQHIPTLIVHNRLDFVCPLQQAYELHKNLPNSKLVIVPDMGHCSDMLYKIIAKEIKTFL